MKDPTKADLAAAVTKLTEENAGLRDLLTAVSECAAAVPQAAADGERKELRRATHMLVSISLTADPAGHWAWSWGSGQAAGYLREQAAEPVGYEVYKTPDDDDESGEDATVSVAGSSGAGRAPYTGHLRTPAIPAGPDDPHRLALESITFYACCEHCTPQCRAMGISRTGHTKPCTKPGCPSALAAVAS